MDDHKKRYQKKAKSKRPNISGVKAYNKAQRAEQKELRKTFPAAWENFMREEMRAALEAAIAVL